MGSNQDVRKRGIDNYSMEKYSLLESRLVRSCRGEGEDDPDLGLGYAEFDKPMRQPLLLPDGGKQARGYTGLRKPSLWVNRTVCSEFYTLVCVRYN